MFKYLQKLYWKWSVTTQALSLRLFVSTVYLLVAKRIVPSRIGELTWDEYLEALKGMPRLSRIFHR